MDGALNNLNRGVDQVYKWVFRLPQQVEVYSGSFGISVSWISVPFDQVQIKLNDDPWTVQAVSTTTNQFGTFEYFVLTPAPGTYKLQVKFFDGTDWRKIVVHDCVVTEA